MTQDFNEQTGAVPAHSVASPGQLLKAAREAQYRTQAEIAERLHLGVSVVKRIESDDFSYATSPVYIRGYLRNYARVVNVPEHKVLQALQAMGVELPEIEYRPTSATQAVPVYAQGGHSRGHLMRWMSVTIFVIIVAMVILWWEGQKSHNYSPLASQPAAVQSQNDAPMYQVNEAQSANSDAVTNANGRANGSANAAPAPAPAPVASAPAAVTTPAAPSSSVTTAAPAVTPAAPTDSEVTLPPTHQHKKSKPRSDDDDTGYKVAPLKSTEE